MSDTRDSYYQNTPRKEDQGLGGEIYGGAASFGRIMALISAIVGTIIGIIMIAVGIKILVAKSDKISADAVIQSAQCSQWVSQGDKNNPSQINYNCTLTVTYEAEGQTRTGIIVHSDNTIQYVKGEHIKIWYTEANPGSATTEGPIPHALGWILLVLGILIPLGAWFWVWMTRRYKFAAAATGVGDAFQMFTR